MATLALSGVDSLLSPLFYSTGVVASNEEEETTSETSVSDVIEPMPSFRV